MYQSLEYDKTQYILHAKLLPYKRRVQQAIDTAKTAIQNAERPLLSFSAGKDSIVLLDIAVKAGFRGDLMFFKYGIFADVETPYENVDLLKYYSGLHGLKYHIIDCLGEVDCWEQCGRFTLFPKTAEERKVFSHTNRDFAKRSEKFCRESNIDLQIIGMRKSESKQRKIVLSAKGSTYSVKSRVAKTCCPLADLTSDDVWAYIFENGLKYLSIYDYPYIDRRRNRNEITLLYNDGIIRNGAIYHFKKMYPEYFAWIKSHWGDVI